MLIVGDTVRTAAGTVPYRRAGDVLLTLCIALPLLGVATALAPLVLSNAPAIRAFENIAEWWAGLVFTLFFAALAALWRRTASRPTFVRHQFDTRAKRLTPKAGVARSTNRLNPFLRYGESYKEVLSYLHGFRIGNRRVEEDGRRQAQGPGKGGHGSMVEVGDGKSEIDR